MYNCISQFFYCAFLLLLTSCSGRVILANDVHRTDSYDDKIGWLHDNCLAINNKSISKNTSFKVVQLNHVQNTIDAVVLERTEKSGDCQALLDDRRSTNINSGLSFYKVSSENKIDLGIGIVGDLDLNTKSTFGYCTTSEGILFTMKNIDQNRNTQLWKSYYYLGYDTEATCNN
jgi:hypothetical protein